MPTTTHDRPQEMYETDHTSQRPNPVGTEENVTPINFTEISGAYFTDPILTFDEGDSKINSERLQATVTSWLAIVISRILETVEMDVVQTDLIHTLIYLKISIAQLY